MVMVRAFEQWAEKNNKYENTFTAGADAEVSSIYPPAGQEDEMKWRKVLKRCRMAGEQPETACV
jgi:hypothetical protein